MKPEHLSGVTASPSPGGKRSARTTTAEDTFVQSPEVRPTAVPTSESTTFSERLPLVEASALAGHSDEGRRDLQSPDTSQLILNNGSISAGATASELSFGPFRLLPAQLLLLEGDKPVPLGSRALHILMVLLERPGELITKQELMARVWPSLFVELATLTVHISALRRALRDGRDGNRFIINIRGRGYCFVTPIR
jgi:DNA-binding winged helix-turn-helix (wHTH) protein